MSNEILDFKRLKMINQIKKKQSLRPKILIKPKQSINLTSKS